MAHPNVVSIVDFDTDEQGKPFIVMEYIAGTTLAEQIKTKGRLDYQDLFRIMESVCAGLAHAHSKSIIHRDLKPSNIMVSTDSSGQTITKIVDFGIAKKRKTGDLALAESLARDASP